MRKITYALVATALVTIAPFLITFEKGQDVVRGLFEYGIFAVLLFYLAMKRLVAFRYKWILLLGVYVLLVVISWIDLQTILFCKKQPASFLVGVPFVTCFFAMYFLKDLKGFSVRHMSVVLFVSLFVHFGALRFVPTQPLLQFSIPLFLAQKQSYVDRSFLTDDFRASHEATDSVTITKYYV